MRVFALSDLHVDYEANARWIAGLSAWDYTDDALILAGDVSASATLLSWCLAVLAQRFNTVVYVPGNHELWVTPGGSERTSLDKFARVRALAVDNGISIAPYLGSTVSIVPLLGWYDYSFGSPSPELAGMWRDYYSCVWPAHFDEAAVTAYFLDLNERLPPGRRGTLISFSHFLPRIDVMPGSIPPQHRILYPVLGTSGLERQIRALGSTTHVYGHSHVNRRVTLGGVTYVNNALGYPQETRSAGRHLLCVHDA